MPPSKRDQTRIERRLIACLTEACEVAKAEIVGFDWLTYEANYQAFPQSLRIVGVFNTKANKDLAMVTGQGARMIELTSMALGM